MMFDFRYSLLYPDSDRSRFTEETERYLSMIKTMSIERLQEYYKYGEELASTHYESWVMCLQERYGSAFLSFNLHFGKTEDELLGTVMICEDFDGPLTREVIKTETLTMPTIYELHGFLKKFLFNDNHEEETSHEF